MNIQLPLIVAEIYLFSPTKLSATRTRLGEPSKLKTGKTKETFPTSNDPPAPYLSWVQCEVGNEVD